MTITAILSSTIGTSKQSRDFKTQRYSRASISTTNMFSIYSQYRATRPDLESSTSHAARRRKKSQIGIRHTHSNEFRKQTPTLKVLRELAFTYSSKGIIRGTGDSFKAYEVISTNETYINRLLSIGSLVESTVEVQATFPGAHTWAKDGFEYRILPDDFEHILKALHFSGAYMAISNRRRLRAKLVPIMTTWGRLQGFGEYTIAIPVDTVLRDTGGEASFGPVSLAHIDFPDKLRKTLLTFINEWKPKVGLALQLKLTDEEYLSLAVKSINNIWMPTCDIVTRDHLAVLSTLTTTNNDATIYTAVRRNHQHFEAQVIRHNLDHRWYNWYGMPRRGALIFSTSGQPIDGVFPSAGRGVLGAGHSSWVGENDSGTGRTSVECRFLFVDLGKQGFEALQHRLDKAREPSRMFNYD